jgi:predicted RNase H-like HicB family nuclease
MMIGRLSCNIVIRAVQGRWLLVKIKVVVHEAEEGGYWAEVPAIPGCATQGETIEELLKNLHEAVEGCLSVDVEAVKKTPTDRVLEIAV